MTTTCILFQTYFPALLDVFWLLWMKSDSVSIKTIRKKSDAVSSKESIFLEEMF